jgi:glutamate dehydrogenase/leucine dehydrogenase
MSIPSSTVNSLLARSLVNPLTAAAAWPHEATGFGVIFHVREAMKHLGLKPETCVAAIQGFGNVAQYAAIGFIEILKGKVLCVSYYDRAVKYPTRSARKTASIRAS